MRQPNSCEQPPSITQNENIVQQFLHDESLLCYLFEYSSALLASSVEDRMYVDQISDVCVMAVFNYKLDQTY